MAKSSGKLVMPYDDRVGRFLQETGVHLSWPDRSGPVYQPGDEVSIHPFIEVEADATMPPKLFRTMGAHSVCLSPNWPLTAKVGRHSFIAQDVKVMGIAHPIDWVTTHPLTFRDYGPRLAEVEFGKTFESVKFRGMTQPVTVGHGVTIGEAVLLKQGITIGHGAVVRPGALVTRDVEPYTIVGGAPARSFGLRFDAKTVAALLALEWWFVEVEDLADLPVDNAPVFARKLARRLARGRARRDPPRPIKLAKTLAQYLKTTPEGAHG